MNRWAISRAQQKKNRIPPPLTSSDIALFPSRSATTVEVQDWLSQKQTTREKQSNKLRLDLKPWTGEYLHRQVLSVIAKDLKKMKFSKVRKSFLMRFIAAARKLKVGGQG